ncbi:hypothetical protein [Howardella ureilytica]|nr:hypothetical protein [Lachnospiraceae bacterium]
MKKFVQILALITVIAVAVLVILTFIFAFMTTPQSNVIFTRLVAADIIVPVSVYVFLLIVKQIQKKSKRDREDNGM